MATATLPTTRRRRRLSSIGLKLVMAVTGAVFVLFVFVHMYGNLMAFGGADAYNTYAHHLRTIGEPVIPYAGLLWVIRVVLIASVVLHAWAAFSLWYRASNARSQRYAVKKVLGSSLSSRTMRWGGVALLLFIVFHILQFTTYTITPQGAQPTPFDNLVNAFDIWWVTLVYVLAMIALGFHLHHGVWSASQTLGWTNTAQARGLARTFGLVAAIVIAGGFLLSPLAIQFGIIG